MQIVSLLYRTLMPKSVRQVQAKMGQFGYILVHGYLPLKIYPNVYIPRKHNHRTYVHYVESYSVSKVSLNNIWADSLRHTAAAIESVCWDMDQYCGVNTSISIS